MAYSESCPFCHIAKVFPPYEPTKPPPAETLHPGLTSPSTFIVLSTPLLIAFLDIMPLTRGHLLLCPRAHHPKISDVPSPEAAELGRFLPLLSKVLQKVLGVEDWNVVQNNGRHAAQVVDHAHFHLIPRLRAGTEQVDEKAKSFVMFGRGQREEINDDEGEELAKKLRDMAAELLKDPGLKL